MLTIEKVTPDNPARSVASVTATNLHDAYLEADALMSHPKSRLRGVILHRPKSETAASFNWATIKTPDFYAFDYAEGQLAGERRQLCLTDAEVLRAIQNIPANSVNETIYGRGFGSPLIRDIIRQSCLPQPQRGGLLGSLLDTIRPLPLQWIIGDDVPQPDLDVTRETEMATMSEFFALIYGDISHETCNYTDAHHDTGTLSSYEDKSHYFNGRSIRQLCARQGPGVVFADSDDYVVEKSMMTIAFKDKAILRQVATGDILLFSTATWAPDRSLPHSSPGFNETLGCQRVLDNLTMAAPRRR